jgi:hypothetical protein
VTVQLGVHERVRYSSTNRLVRCSLELTPEAGPSPLVPQQRILEVLAGGRPDDDPQGHFSKRCFSEARTSSQGAPSSGFRW